MKREIYAPSQSFPGGLITPRENYYVASTKEAAFIFWKAVYTQSLDWILKQCTSNDTERSTLHPCDSRCSSVTESLCSFEKNAQALVSGILRWGLGVQRCVLGANWGWEPSCGKQTGPVLVSEVGCTVTSSLQMTDTFCAHQSLIAVGILNSHTGSILSQDKWECQSRLFKALCYYVEW